MKITMTIYPSHGFAEGAMGPDMKMSPTSCRCLVNRANLASRGVNRRPSHSTNKI